LPITPTTTDSHDRKYSHKTPDDPLVSSEISEFYAIYEPEVAREEIRGSLADVKRHE
jgi:hypothetical protein